MLQFKGSLLQQPVSSYTHKGVSLTATDSFVYCKMAADKPNQTWL